jgi:glycine hydroxymethyltransferase
MRPISRGFATNLSVHVSKLVLNVKPVASNLTEAERLAPALRDSLDRQERLLRTSLVLNPVENFPFPEDLAVAAGPLHGLYNSDKVRTREQRLVTDHQFAGRAALEADSRSAYAAWAAALGAEDATLRLLSGLQAHAVLFMSISRPGARVLLLSVQAGGHMSTGAILGRLGLQVTEMPVDDHGMCVDLQRTLAMCEDDRPDFVFVDRSEGLVVEDFSSLTEVGAVSIFDASQYLTNVIVGDHPNPFADGFDLVVSSVHKNFPGPQKALLATRTVDETWRDLLRGASSYVSNMHVASTYAATLTLARSRWLASYSRRMLVCATALEDELLARGVPAVERPRDQVPTHHVWIREGSRARAYDTFEALEACGIFTNYRRLPYSLGFGVRLGLSAAVRIGLDEADVPALAELIAAIRRDGATSPLQRAARAFSQLLWERDDQLGD